MEESGKEAKEEMHESLKENEEIGEDDPPTPDEENYEVNAKQDTEFDEVAIKSDALEFDTSAEFAEVFGSKSEFDSWEEFTHYLEEFQSKSKTSYKPRSACSIDYANERRINGPIPERFVYSNVKMICFHFGSPLKRGAGQRRNYVGKGCGAFMNVSYNRGALRITQSHLIHTNHEQTFENETPLRNLRVFNFTEELDLIIAREVLKTNPFEFTNGEKQWIQAVERLKNFDEKLADITPRLVKKRIRFLVDKYLAVSHGRRPSPEDELGNILCELDKSRREIKDVLVSKGRKKRGPGRPRKRHLSDDEDYDNNDSIADISTDTYTKQLKTSHSSSSTSSSDMTMLLSYLQKKDDEDRKLRQKEIDLRKEELSFQRQRFDFEKIERKAHLEILKAQAKAFEHSMSSKQNTAPIVTKDTNQVTEYTIVVDNNNQMLETLPTLG